VAWKSETGQRTHIISFCLAGRKRKRQDEPADSLADYATSSSHATTRLWIETRRETSLASEIANKR